LTLSNIWAGLSRNCPVSNYNLTIFGVISKTALTELHHKVFIKYKQMTNARASKEVLAHLNTVLSLSDLLRKSSQTGEQF